MSTDSAKYQHKARKRFGQNFLHDQNIISRIVSHIAPKPEDNIIEIGPGLGAITERLLQGTHGKLRVVEIDRDLIKILKEKYSTQPDFSIHEGDALQADFTSLFPDATDLKIVGNLPYNISTPLIFHLLKSVEHVQCMYFMLQKEVVERLTAGVGDNHYGRLGIMVQYYCDAQNIISVGPGAFNPAPKVDSAVVRLQPHKVLPYPAKCVATLKHVVTQAFSQRRKTLRNTLKKIIDVETLESLGIDASLRPEKITLEQYVIISDHLAA